MILSRVVVKKLYGKYDYDISFNEDITLLYGMNGCGKTTILNIVTAIITGSLYKLFAYDFIAVSLYCEEEKQKETIVVERLTNKLRVCFASRTEEIEELTVPEERRRRRSYDYISDYYVEIYPFLLDIRHTFNYVYLALNRTTQLSDDYDEMYYRRRYYYGEDGVVEPEHVSVEIKNVENLITKKSMEISAEINKINNEFRNKVLKKSTNLQTYNTDEEALSTIISFSEKDIIKISNSYIRILEELNLVNEKEKRKCEDFFANCIETSRKQTENSDILPFLLQSYELTRIQEIVKIAEEAERRKAKIHQPIQLFLDTINEFIGKSECEKRVDIDVNGRVFFFSEDDERKLSIQFLSSGEKQLIVFFANLILGVNSQKTGIFVVDEPELSLHLSWQKVFIDKALEVNKNVQLIFATHAPEIVGNYREKMVKLERKRVM